MRVIYSYRPILINSGIGIGIGKENMVSEHLYFPSYRAVVVTEVKKEAGVYNYDNIFAVLPSITASSLAVQGSGTCSGSLVGPLGDGR